VVGGTVGVGIFLTPAGMSRALAAPGLVFLVWAFMGAAALCGALSLGELAARYPEAGGNYVYLREAYGPSLAFLYGWKCLLIMDPGLTAALAMGLGAYAQATLPSLSPRAVALGAIVSIAAANVLGLRLAGAIGHFLAVAKIALLGGARLLGLRLRRGRRVSLRAVLRAARGAGPLVPAVAGALVMAFFSFGGWWEAAKLAGEVRDPGARCRAHCALGVSAVTLLYVGVSAVFLYLVPPGRKARTRPSPRRRPGALRRERRPRALGARGGLRDLGALRVHDLRAAALLRDGARRRRAALRRLDAPAHGDAGDGDRAAGGARRAPGAARQLRDDRGVLRVRDGGVPGPHGGGSLPPAAARGGRLPRAGLAVTPLVFLAMLLLMLALLGVSSPRQALLGLLVVGAGVPVYRFFIQPRRAAHARLEEA
jgi:APA family basic amino acid/polyamine antiporter